MSTRSPTKQEIIKAAERWLAGDPDPTTRAELSDLLRRDDEAELRDRFAVRLEFGTAGLRGLLGAGENRMNRAIVIQTAAGLARYLLDHVPDAKSRGVVIAYDGRHGSVPFAHDSAAVLAKAGIAVHLFPSFAPTPLASFAVVELGAAAGVMVTASHNPARYNGYKVYWTNGAQIVPPHDEGIAHAIAQIGAANEVPLMELALARKNGIVRDVPRAVTETYFKRVVALLHHPDTRPPMSIVYTPLHGVGDALASAALRHAGFDNVHPVAEQIVPDPDFPTVRFPNPEEPGAMDLALALAAKLEADLILANDPDADRLAVAIPDERGGHMQLTGNQVGTMLGAYLLGQEPGRVAISNKGSASEASAKEGTASARVVLASLVSSPMLGEIAHSLGVRYEETLTGFKWIATRAIELAKQGIELVLGYEEALGYSAGDVVRDKDGIGAAVLFAELAAVCKSRNISLRAYLESLYRRYGLYLSAQRSLTREGVDGIAAIEHIMHDLRAAPPTTVAGRAVVAVRDLQSLRRRTSDGIESSIALPPSNVLVFELEHGGRIIARPSGTEPKIKYYFDHRESVDESEPLASAEARGRAMLAALEKGIVHV